MHIPGSIWSHNLRSSSVHGLRPDIPIQASSFTALLTSQCSLSLSELPGSPSLSVVQQSLSRVQLFATLWTIAPPGSSVRGILQARILEWILPCPPPGDYSRLRDRTLDSCVSCIGRLDSLALSHQGNPLKAHSS